MANEITARVMLQVSNGGTKQQIANKTVKLDQTTAATDPLSHLTEQVVGTSEESLSIGDIATPGMVYLENMDATNFVTYGNATGNLGFRLRPGGHALVDIAPGKSILVQADTAACKLRVGVLAD